jgi:hypothetical protein
VTDSALLQFRLLAAQAEAAGDEPAVNLPALNEALDIAASAAHVAVRGDEPDFAGRLIRRASEVAGMAFPAGSEEAAAFTVILRAIGKAA